MDELDNLQREPELMLTEMSSLEEFADDLRHRIGYDPETQKELYYTERDVRSFLGGLAMSQLVLLQGISGTGKTSLPLSFARAVGGGTEVVSVQAGWRDKHDLLGHFNSFEKRFYERDFLQALYRAQTPAFADRPFVIVLDEMNLSHPEQYFADFLSALELDAGKREITLLTSGVKQAPQFFVDGRKLRIPENVWFVGTANHDETTVDFADKTYDRSHVMELPRHREDFNVQRTSSRHPVSFAALQTAFGRAQEEYGATAKQVLTAFDELTGTLEQEFQVGWGNRLERQAHCYVPVVVAAGGDVGEAVDHLLSTKVLRKIRNRYDTTPDGFEKLSSQLEDMWMLLDADGPVAPASMRIIEIERRRLERGI
jgi:hypothetical protein